jgi:hypothetical protein
MGSIRARKAFAFWAFLFDRDKLILAFGNFSSPIVPVYMPIFGETVLLVENIHE